MEAERESAGGAAFGFFARGGSLLDGVLRIGCYISAALVVLVTVLLLFEVVTRYVLQRPTIWSLDMATYFLLYLALTGAPWLLQEEGHVKIEIITSHFSAGAQAFVTGVTSVVAAASCGIFSWQAASTTWQAYRAGQFIDRSIVVPRYLLTWIMAVGTFFLCLQFARRACTHFQTFFRSRTREAP